MSLSWAEEVPFSAVEAITFKEGRIVKAVPRKGSKVDLTYSSNQLVEVEGADRFRSKTFFVEVLKINVNGSVGWCPDSPGSPWCHPDDPDFVKRWSAGNFTIHLNEVGDIDWVELPNQPPIKSPSTDLIRHKYDFQIEERQILSLFEIKRKGQVQLGVSSEIQNVSRIRNRR